MSLEAAWVIGDDEPGYFARMIGKSRDFNVGQIHIGPPLCRCPEDVTEPDERAETIRRLLGHACDLNITCLIWVQEPWLSPDAEGPPDLDSSDFRDTLARRYRDLFNKVPTLDGIVLDLAGPEISLFNTTRVNSKRRPSERVTYLANLLHSICAESGKSLLCRTALGPAIRSHDELQALYRGLNRSEEVIPLLMDADLLDGLSEADLEEQLEGTNQHPLFMEVDLIGRHLGSQAIPWCDVESVQAQILMALDANAVGVAGLVDHGDRHLFGSPAHPQLQAFHLFAETPDAEAETLVESVLAGDFGPRAAPAVARALSRTNDIAEKIFYCGDVYWGSDMGRVPGFDHMRANAVAWPERDGDAARTEQELLNPTPATLKWVLAEKDEALALCEESLREIEAARADLRERDYAFLRDAFERAYAVAYLFRCLLEAYFHVRFIEETEGEKQRKWVEEILRSSLELVKAGDTIFYHWGNGFALGPRDDEQSLVSKALPRLVNEMQKRVEAAVAEEE